MFIKKEKTKAETKINLASFILTQQLQTFIIHHHFNELI